MLYGLIKCAVIYIVMMISVRLMGKREIGQLQPADLVITILISEIAAAPVSNDKELPLNMAYVAFFVIMEISVAFLSMKIPGIRRLIQGNSIAVIEKGKINQKMLKRMRMTVDDLTASLRLKDVFNIEDVNYAIVETNGQISVEMKNGQKTVVQSDMNIFRKDTGIAYIIISDGRLISKNLKKCGINENQLDKALTDRHLERKNVFILTADESGILSVIVKE